MGVVFMKMRSFGKALSYYSENPAAVEIRDVFKFWMLAIHKNMNAQRGKGWESTYHGWVVFFPN
jgi:hypothetical protein